MAIKYRAHGL